jgi:hypothetical protein
MSKRSKNSYRISFKFSRNAINLMRKKLLRSIISFAAVRVINIIFSGDYGEIPGLLRFILLFYKTK